MITKFIAEGSMLGLMSGMFLGIINYMIVFLIPSIVIIYFVMFGAALGLFLGVINGIALGILTAFFRNHVAYKFQYRVMMGIVSVVISDVLTAGAVHSTLSAYSVTHAPNSSLILIAVGTATLAAIFNSQLLAISHLKRREQLT